MGFSSQDGLSGVRVDTADRLHSIAIHLLRRVRRQDTLSGLTAARLSALSVLVFAGPTSIGALSEAKQVQLPTMSRLVSSLEQSGLVERAGGSHDKRITWYGPLHKVRDCCGRDAGDARHWPRT